MQLCREMGKVFELSRHGLPVVKELIWRRIIGVGYAFKKKKNDP